MSTYHNHGNWHGAVNNGNGNGNNNNNNGFGTGNYNYNTPQSQSQSQSKDGLNLEDKKKAMAKTIFQRVYGRSPKNYDEVAQMVNFLQKFQTFGRIRKELWIETLGELCVAVAAVESGQVTMMEIVDLAIRRANPMYYHAYCAAMQNLSFEKSLKKDLAPRKNENFDQESDDFKDEGQSNNNNNNNNKSNQEKIREKRLAAFAQTIQFKSSK